MCALFWFTPWITFFRSVEPLGYELWPAHLNFLEFAIKYLTYLQNDLFKIYLYILEILKYVNYNYWPCITDLTYILIFFITIIIFFI
jgi:hypothetical protein